MKKKRNKQKNRNEEKEKIIIYHNTVIHVLIIFFFAFDKERRKYTKSLCVALHKKDLANLLSSFCFFTLLR